MNSNEVWLQWVRHGKAYTITKSRRKAVQIARIEAAALFAGYAAGYIEERTGKDHRRFEHDTYYRRFIEFGYGEILENDYELDYMLDEFCESLLDEYNPFDEYPTLKRFLFYACDIIASLRMYISIGTLEVKEICKKRIRTRMEALHSPNAGAIARRAFREIETELRKEAAV